MPKKKGRPKAAKNVQRVVRRTVSVPTDLNRRMTKASDVNWSAIACQAFEQKLGELAQQKEKKTMQDVLDRLRASKRKHESKAYQDGFEAGKEWSKNHAEAPELERLDSFRDGEGFDEFFEMADNGTAYSATELLVETIFGGDNIGSLRDDAFRFWDFVSGGDAERVINDASYAKGFVEGALEVWRQVQEQL